MNIESFHFLFAWVWILTGLVTGMLLGIFFHDEAWLGGYASWRRRLVRLGHISFLGTGLLLLAFTFSLDRLGLEKPPLMTGILFVLGAVTMPLFFFLSAWREGFRKMFFIPVLSLIGATADFILRVLLQ